VRRGERSITQLPRPLILGFVILFGIQLGSHHFNRNSYSANYQTLEQPLSADVYQGVAMGSGTLMSYLLAIRLQLHDNQLGQHIRYSLIDYGLLIKWLETISEISPDTEYPMLLASRIYSSTSDIERLQQLLGYIETNFDRNPQLHWRRMTEATLIAKHNMNNLELALRLAEKVASQPPEIKMPAWARDFRFLLLAELNEMESAIAIIQALLSTEAVSDPDEERFLRGKLSKFQQKLFETQQKQ
jgi:hypothetical protein